MIEVSCIDEHGMKVSIQFNCRGKQYFTELAAIELRDKLDAILPPTSKKWEKLKKDINIC